jgi:Putative homoserine kinase type II (protein kinase fold)
VRNEVFWSGVTPTDADTREYANRHLLLRQFDGPATLARARGAVIRMDSRRPAGLGRWLKAYGKLAIDLGCALCLLANSDRETTLIEHALKIAQIDGNSLRLRKRVRVFAQPDPHVVPQFLQESTSEPVLNPNLQIDPKPDDPMFELLLKRAFGDCASISVQPLGPGQTATVVSVYAQMAGSLAGPRPLPFFAKFGKAEAIEQEYHNYGRYVAGFIPFNLRPNLDPFRCITGYADGLLVGNLIAHSESLQEVIQRGQSDQLIYALFDDALGGWRIQAYESDRAGLHPANFLDFFPQYCRPVDVPPEIVEHATRRGAQLAPGELSALFERFPPMIQRRAPMHGDLHGENVRVRGRDTILIDFQKVRLGPLVADPACLEVNLVFRASKDDTNDGWHETVDRLYSIDLLRSPPPPAASPSRREWMWTAVRQIRMMALPTQIEPWEYQLTLALFLFRRSRQSTISELDVERAAYAYVMAERLLQNLQQEVLRS